MEKTNIKKPLIPITAGEGGAYDLPPDPKMSAPKLPGDRRKRQDRLCMKATGLRVESDGTLKGTRLVVRGVDGIERELGGLISFDMKVQRGYPRVTAVISQTYVHEDIKEYGEEAGKTVTTGEGGEAILTIDVFERS